MASIENTNSEPTRHTGIPVSTYTLMHADEIIAIAHRESNSVDIIIPKKLPFGLRNSQSSINYIDFTEWLNKRVGNLQRSYMNKVYMARQVGRNLENILRDSCALSITDKFWVNHSDINTTWAKLQEKRDSNEILNNVALTGETAHLDWEKVKEGTTSLFATKGNFPKAIQGNTMLKRGGTQEREWIATVIGKALDLPVQNAVIINSDISPIPDNPSETDNTLVQINLFTDENTSLVHASELFANNPDWSEACHNGMRHRYFYDRLPDESMKHDFEQVLILNWLVSNHDMHEENFGCLYDPDTFIITGIAPSFDHNSSDYDGLIPDIDVPDIVVPSLIYHKDVIEKIKVGKLENALSEISNWLTEEQKQGIRNVANELISEYEKQITESEV